MSQPMTPPPPPGQKKKLSPLAWVAIGCGAIAVIGILVVGAMAVAGGMFLKKQADKFEKNPAVAAAELMIRANPEVELVDSDLEAGTITYREKSTGEEVTVNAEDLQEGKISITTAEGTSTFDASGGENGGEIRVTNEKGEEAVFTAGAGAPKNLPAWLPVYAGTVQGSYDATNAQERSAAFTVTTTDSARQVMDFYETRLKEAGLEVEKSSFETNGALAGGSVTGTSADGKRTVNVAVSAGDAGAETSAFVTFTEQQ